MFFSSSHGELILIIDVQSSIVRGSVVLFHSTAIPSVLFTHNVEIPYKPHGGSGYLIKTSLQAIEEIVRVVKAKLRAQSNCDDIPKHISNVHYVLSSPWVVSQAKTISTKFKEETAISRAYITGIIWEERTKMTANANDDIRIIEEKVFDVRLNGYSVRSWESRHTKELDISFVVSIAGGRMIDRFIESVSGIVHREGRVQFHSSLFLQHLGIQRVVSDSSNYTLIHVHGELTDVALIHANSCSFFGSYPLGIQNVIRTIASNTKTTLDAAESTLNLIEKGDIDSAKAKKEFEVVSGLKSLWINEFKKLLEKNPVQEILPNRIIISARNHEDFFVSCFKSAFPQTSVEPLLLENILPHVKYENQAERLRLTGLYVIAIHSLLK